MVKQFFWQNFGNWVNLTVLNVLQVEKVITAGVQDSVSVAILRMFHGVMLDAYSPRQVVGDGNCLYGAVSLALYGTESVHMYVRFLTCIELILQPYAYSDSFLHSLRIIYKLQLKLIGELK